MRISLSIFIVFCISFKLSAGEPVSKSFWGSVAIDGFDITSYYQPEVRLNHKAIEGSHYFTVEWNGAEWRFASQLSASRFSSDPERYRPKYNGFCANALSVGAGLVETDGRVWEFFGDYLYLFYSQKGLKRWLEGDWREYKRESDKAWLEHTK